MILFVAKIYTVFWKLNNFFCITFFWISYTVKSLLPAGVLDLPYIPFYILKKITFSLQSYSMNITTVKGFDVFINSLKSGVDLVLSCVDNYEARMVINQVTTISNNSDITLL